MTAFTVLSDATLAANKPGTQSVFRAFRDNLLAAAEGSPNAPRFFGTPVGRVAVTGGSSLDSGAIMTSEFDEYWFIVRNLLPSVDGPDLRLRIGTGATPTIQSGAGTYKWALGGTKTTGGGAITESLNSDNTISLTFSTLGLDGTGGSPGPAGWSGIIKLILPTASVRKQIRISDAIYQANDGSESLVHIDGGATWFGASTAITAIQIYPSSGNVTGYMDVVGIPPIA